MLHIFVPNLNDREITVLRYLRQKREQNIKVWIPRAEMSRQRGVAGLQSIPSDWRPIEKAISNVDWKLCCMEWKIKDLQVASVEDSFRYWMKMYKEYNDNDEWVILSSIQRDKGQAVLFADDSTDKAYPNEWMKFQCISSKNELESFLNDRNFLIYHFCAGPRFEVARDSFRHTRKNGAVYREKKTGYYWYLDTFHRDHIEVWDSQGQHHLGEADVNTGQLDKTKADKTKHPIL